MRHGVQPFLRPLKGSLARLSSISISINLMGTTIFVEMEAKADGPHARSVSADTADAASDKNEFRPFRSIPRPKLFLLFVIASSHLLPLCRCGASVLFAPWAQSYTS